MDTDSLLALFSRAGCGSIGISPDLEVFSGYDVREPGANATPDPHDDSRAPLSKADKLKLASEMIQRWRHYRKAVERT